MSFKQWTTPDGTSFYPAGDVVKVLPPGYYGIAESMTGGLYFEKRPTKTEELMIFPDSGSKRVVEEIENFWGLENRFKDDGIPYKRGILLYGPPGSGKTCTLRIVVENLTKKHEGIVVDFPGPHAFVEGYKIIRQIHPSMPLIIMMEDLDAILMRSSESDVLNLLDGMHDIDKTIFLATTNYPEKLGSRIMNRPSRFDKRIFIDMPNAESREMFIRSKLIKEDEKIIKQWVEDTDGFSIAHIKELYVANKILGDEYGQAVDVLRRMKSSPHSTAFDEYRVEEPVCGSWASFGTGKAYAEAKRRKGNVIFDIADNLGEI